MTQTTIEFPPYQKHSATSKAAATSIVPKAGTLRAMVLEFLKDRRYWGIDGATDEEIQDELEMPQNTARPRRVELVRAGLVIDSGRSRPTKSGRMATVWVVNNQVTNSGD